MCAAKVEASPVIVVGIADCGVTSDPDTVLVTYALGSCIAVSAHDPVTKIGGLLHFMLPESTLDSKRGQKNPYVYADTGIPLLFERILELGANRQRLVVFAAGGAQVLDDKGIFNIGKKNDYSLRKILSKLGTTLHAEAIGGVVSRSVRLELGTGRLIVREGMQPARDLLPSAQPKQEIRL